MVDHPYGGSKRPEGGHDTGGDCGTRSLSSRRRTPAGRNDRGRVQGRPARGTQLAGRTPVRHRRTVAGRRLGRVRQRDEPVAGEVQPHHQRPGQLRGEPQAVPDHLHRIGRHRLAGHEPPAGPARLTKKGPQMFKANFESISTAGSDIVGGANKIEQQLNDMDSRLRPLQSDWTGSASEAYEQARATWTTTINEMKQLLAEIGAAVTESGQDYQQTDTANARRFT